jgi:hypothetical protein
MVGHLKENKSVRHWKVADQARKCLVFFILPTSSNRNKKKEGYPMVSLAKTKFQLFQMRIC